MAVAKLICGDCGRELSPDDVVCPGCGATITKPGIAQPIGSRRCEVCGHTNPGAGDYCVSCGARLATGGEVRRPAPQVKKKQQPKPASRAKEAGVTGSHRSAGRSIEPWQIVSGIAVVALVAFLIYTSLSKSPAPASAASPAGMPAMPRQMPSVEEIQTFEKRADANPSDADARLLLANALHDKGLFSRAAQEYKKYLVMRPDNPDARVDLGICYYSLAQADSANGERLYPLALQEMETAFKKSPTHQPAAFNIGIVNLHLGNMEASRTWFKRAVDLNKSSELGTKAQQMLDQHTFPQ